MLDQTFDLKLRDEKVINQHETAGDMIRRIVQEFIRIEKEVFTHEDQ